MVVGVTRHEDEIARAVRKLAAAAFSVLSNGGTVAEAEAAFAEGIAEAQAMQGRLAGAGDRARQMQRSPGARSAEAPVLTATALPGVPRHAAA